MLFSGSTAASTVEIYSGGSVLFATATDNAFHAIQCTASSASGPMTNEFYIDGSSTTGGSGNFALSAKLGNADDLILCRRGKAEEALQQLRQIMGKLKLTVNKEKTRICKVPEGEFDFLGYTFGRVYSATGKAYLGCGPSRKSIKRMVENVHVSAR